MYDPRTQYFIIAGNTTSDDFVADRSNHGFVVAIDLDANW